MSVGVASRFAVLRIDDDVSEKKSKKNSDSKKTENKQKNAKPTVVTGKGAQASTKAKGKATTNQQQKKKPVVTEQQWDQWQKKDEEVSNNNFVDDMNQAILLSKVDFEKNKKVYDERKKAAEEESKRPTKKGKKNSKPQTMSLDQFNNLNAEGENSPRLEANGAHGDDGSNEEEFFKSISHETREAMIREEVLATRKRRETDRGPPGAAAVAPASTDDPVAQARLADALEKKDICIATLTAEVERLKAELLGVKSRNKKLCQILANGEMKDKAELLVELDKMHRVKDELSFEVANLHVQLEQERSKSHALASEPKKAQGKKRLTSDSTQ